MKYYTVHEKNRMVKKKILIVSNTAWSVYNFRLGLINPLIEQGYKVFVLAKDDGYEARVAAEGCFFISLKNLDRKGKNPLREISLFFRMFLTFKRVKPDLILSFTIKPNIYGAIAAKFLKIKCICTVTGLGYVFLNKRFFTYLVRLMYKIAFHFPEEVFFQNTDDLNHFIKLRIVNSSKTRLVRGSGVNTEHFTPVLCDSVKRFNQKISFLFVGRILYDKGVNEFVEASKIVKQQYSETEFNMLGSIDNQNPSSVPFSEVKKLEENNIINYLGYVEDVRQYICVSDVIVLPSYREGIPRALIEAMAMAKPIITTNVAGCREVVDENKNGYLVPVKNVPLLADAMVKFIELDDAKKQMMGRISRKKAISEFDEKIVTQAYLEDINRMFSENHQRN